MTCVNILIANSARVCFEVILTAYANSNPESSMNKWPSLLCAAHCALTPLLPVFAGTSLLHNPAMEFVEYALIGVVFLVLLRTLYRLREPEHKLFLVGIVLTASLLVSVLFLPEGFMIAGMLAVAGFQIFAERRLCSCTPAAGMEPAASSHSS